MPYTLSIPTTSLSAPSSNSSIYTQYHLTISTPLRKSTLLKRYSDFLALHTALVSATGSAPPAPLPKKSWFSRTVNNDALTEARRKGLELYIQAIEAAPDPKWREAAVYRAFLNFPPSDGAARHSRAETAAEGPPAMSASGWLDVHTQLKQLLQEARGALARRESATSTTGAHEASAQAKKWLVKSHTLIVRLEEGLRGLESGRGGERLGEGEVRRRRDLVGRARKEREALEGVLNAWVGVRAGVLRADEGGVGQTQKAELFAGSGASPTRSAAMPGTFPGPNGNGAPRAGRVLGAPAKETERTRELDNQGVLQLQEQIMRDQDMDVEELGKVVRRMREMGVAINEELVEQSQLLDVLDQDVDRVGGKIGVARKRLRKIN